MRTYVRDGVLAICLLLIAVLGYKQYMPGSRMPEWVRIQEGPVVHGVDKFYRAMYVRGNIATAGNLRAGNFIETDVATSITASTTEITPTGTFQPLSATAMVTPTLATSGYQTGTLLILQNTVTYTIVVEDTGSAKLSDDWTANQYDTLGLQFDGTNWVEIFRSSN